MFSLQWSLSYVIREENEHLKYKAHGTNKKLKQHFAEEIIVYEFMGVNKVYWLLLQGK